MTTPPGPEENFQIVRTVGAPPRFDFPPKAHWDIATELGLMDFARGAKLSGSGFVLYTGLGALLERGLIAFMLDMHIARHGYTEVSTPFFLSRESVRASAHLPKFQPEMYHDAEADLFALPTAEPALVNIHRDEILDGRDLPLNYVAYSPCWRREAGAAGKDTRGLLRVHQFDKVEMVKYTLPEASADELENLVTNATDILDALGLCYRIKLLAAGDMGFPAAKCYDIEIYAPGAGAWLEISSCSNCEDFQSRRGNIRFRREPGAKPEFPHLLNASGTALPRLVATLLETYQRRRHRDRAPGPRAVPGRTNDSRKGAGTLMQFTHERTITLDAPCREVRRTWPTPEAVASRLSHIRAIAPGQDDDLAHFVICLDACHLEFAVQQTMNTEDTFCWQSLGTEFLYVLCNQPQPERRRHGSDRDGGL